MFIPAEFSVLPAGLVPDRVLGREPSLNCGLITYSSNSCLHIMTVEVLYILNIINNAAIKPDFQYFIFVKPSFIIRLINAQMTANHAVFK